MKSRLYIDYSNVTIEARRVSAVRLGYAEDMMDAMVRNVLDPHYRLDIRRLRAFCTDGADGEAVLCGSFRTSEYDSPAWDLYRSMGFEVVLQARNSFNQEKAVDGNLMTRMLTDTFDRPGAKEDLVILVAGDRDYVPAVRALVAAGVCVEVHFWDHASWHLKEAATEFVRMDRYLECLRYVPRPFRHGQDHGLPPSH